MTVLEEIDKFSGISNWRTIISDSFSVKKRDSTVGRSGSFDKSGRDRKSARKFVSEDIWKIWTLKEDNNKLSLTSCGELFLANLKYMIDLQEDIPKLNIYIL